MESMLDSYAQMVERKTRDLELEKEQVEKLLLNIMPRSVYEEFKTFGVVTPQLYKPVSVLMLDFVGFTQMAASEDPTVTVGELNDIFTAFDRIAEQFGCERIKTLGDAYLAVAGLPHPNLDHARAVANSAIRFIRYLERRNQSHKHTWECRIGLASGSVVGSVVGIQKYVYDVFGPAVNLASRLQVLSEPMEITVHAAMVGDLADEFRLKDGGVHPVRGFGEQQILKLIGMQ
jgi:class 3 adenylate cyclase